jgi:hypothetical protein
MGGAPISPERLEAIGLTEGKVICVAAEHGVSVPTVIKARHLVRQKGGLEPRALAWRYVAAWRGRGRGYEDIVVMLRDEGLLPYITINEVKASVLKRKPERVE